MAVAAVSRDTVRSSSPPAATPVTVSVTATLLLAVAALTDEASQMAGGVGCGRLQLVFDATSMFRCHLRLLGEVTGRHGRVGGHLNRPKLADPCAMSISGGRAPTCGQRPQRPHGAGRTVSGL